MALPFLYSWWHYSDKEPVAPDPPKDIPCEEEEKEDDEICWFLGQMLLFYCMAVLVLRLGHFGLNRFLVNQPCGSLTCDWKAHAKGSPGCKCRCHCQLTLRGLFRKLLGVKGECCAREAPAAASPPIKKRLKKRLSVLSQQTFCDSDSSGSASLDSLDCSWKWSQTGDSVSMSSRKKKHLLKHRDPESPWMQEQPCHRCKAKRTREWLVRHFYDRSSPLHPKPN